MKKKLFVFSNENIFSQDEKFFCDNIDIKSIDQQHCVEHSSIGLDIELQESPRLYCFIM